MYKIKIQNQYQNIMWRYHCHCFKELTFLETSIPIIYLSDTTFKLYKRNWLTLNEQKKLDGLINRESTAMSKLVELVYHQLAEWAASSAIWDTESTKIDNSLWHKIWIMFLQERIWSVIKEWILHINLNLLFFLLERKIGMKKLEILHFKT